MSSSSGSKQTIHNEENNKSYFQKTVCLRDWWLIKAENDFKGKRLAVAGLSREQAVRVFTSAPIIKRFDVFTLETADGICVIIKGFINKSRSIDNGFSSEIVNHFMFGFPIHWEELTQKCFGVESTTAGEKESTLREEGTLVKKTSKKIINDTHVSPVTKERKEKKHAVSPECQSYKRSRSGRLLVPTLEFWRNQIAIYDVDRNITGIQEGLEVELPSGGSRSASQKRRR